MNEEIFVTLDDLGIKIKNILQDLPNVNILTDDLENKILNQDNIIANKILQIRPDSLYKNSNVTKTSIGLEDVTNDKQVKYEDKASILEAIGGTNDEKWMTAFTTKEAIIQYSPESDSTLHTLLNNWLYGGF